MRFDIIYSELLDLYIKIEYDARLHSISFIKQKNYLKQKEKSACAIELEGYFEGKIKHFLSDIDISYLSPFEQKVLEETRKIKYGRTVTYSELARSIGSSAIRAVGNALGKNPIPIIIPCHRVVAKNGIGGYSGGIDIKIRLLEHERKYAFANNL